MAYDSPAPRRVSPAKLKRLTVWSKRKPCLALMGEFSAGKSTLLNFLIEENILPTQATATELAPVWFSHGNAPAYWVDENGQQHALDLAELQTVPITARFIRIFAEAEILEHCDVIDTPGISDPNLAVESWRFAAGQANMVLWCTSATQAWRETERAAWTSLPERLREHSVLVVTRADKLLTDVDRDKVARRMARETGGLFGGIVFMATPDAVEAKAQMTAGDDAAAELWQASGAEALLDALAERFEAIYAAKAEMAARYHSDGSSVTPLRRVETPAEETDEAGFEDAGAQAFAWDEAPAEETPDEAPPRSALLAEPGEVDWQNADAAPEETGDGSDGSDVDDDDGDEVAAAPSHDASGADEDMAYARPVTPPYHLTRPIRPEIDASRRTERPGTEEGAAMFARLRDELTAGEAADAADTGPAAAMDEDSDALVRSALSGGLAPASGTDTAVGTSDTDEETGAAEGFAAAETSGDAEDATLGETPDDAEPSRDGWEDTGESAWASEPDRSEETDGGAEPAEATGWDTARGDAAEPSDIGSWDDGQHDRSEPSVDQASDDGEDGADERSGTRGWNAGQDDDAAPAGDHASDAGENGADHPSEAQGWDAGQGEDAGSADEHASEAGGDDMPEPSDDRGGDEEQRDSAGISEAQAWDTGDRDEAETSEAQAWDTDDRDDAEISEAQTWDAGDGGDAGSAAPAIAADAVSPQVALWRAIAARASDDPSPREMMAMIDELMAALYPSAAPAEAPADEASAPDGDGDGDADAWLRRA